MYICNFIFLVLQSIFLLQSRFLSFRVSFPLSKSIPSTLVPLSVLQRQFSTFEVNFSNFSSNSNDLDSIFQLNHEFSCWNGKFWFSNWIFFENHQFTSYIWVFSVKTSLNSWILLINIKIFTNNCELIVFSSYYVKISARTFNFFVFPINCMNYRFQFNTKNKTSVFHLVTHNFGTSIRGFA